MHPSKYFCWINVLAGRSNYCRAMRCKIGATLVLGKVKVVPGEVEKWEKWTSCWIGIALAVRGCQPEHAWDAGAAATLTPGGGGDDLGYATYPVNDVRMTRNDEGVGEWVIIEVDTIRRGTDMSQEYERIERMMQLSLQRFSQFFGWVNVGKQTLLPYRTKNIWHNLHLGFNVGLRHFYLICNRSNVSPTLARPRLPRCLATHRQKDVVSGVYPKGRLLDSRKSSLIICLTQHLVDESYVIE